MQNPFFNKAKPVPTVAAVEQKLAAGQPAPEAKPNGLMSGGGMMGGMLKTLGLNPDMIDETAGKVIGGIEDMNARLDRIEAQLALVNKALIALGEGPALAASDERMKSIESMLQDMLGRTASGTL